ncbi:MAG: flavin reductase family protein [Gemmatimonadales bacterium]|jgi:flavin reductase (DIM6/NTAB) family NADH-FMN oxidoreductase RutF
MEANDKKTALRMIPYGLYVLTGQAEDGRVAAATVNWVSQVSFEPPLVAVGVKADSGGHAIIKETGSFALNMLGKGQEATAFAFFKPTEREGDTVGAVPFHAGSTGAPILDGCPAYVECRLIETVERGDHSVFVGEVVDAGVAQSPAGRPDDAILMLKDLGEKIFYGG